MIAVSEVALGGGVVPGDEPDPPGKPGEGALALGGEEALRGELCLEALEGREVLAEPEALDRARAVGSRRGASKSSGPAEDVDALAVREVEPQRVELPAGHGHARGRRRPPDP